MFIMPFSDPNEVRRRMESRARRAMKNAIPYDQFKLPKRVEDVGIIAGTFKPENPLETIFPDVQVDEDPWKPSGLVDPSGTLRYRRSRFPKLNGLPIVSSQSLYVDDGRAFFTDDVVIPLLEHKREGWKEWKIWMGLTPMELHTQNSGIRAATKKVVIAGLGMGWLFRQIAKKKTVKEIVVIEKDRNLLDWFGVKLCEQEEKVVDIICDDFFNEESDWPYRFGEDTRFILDIWPGLGDAAWDFRLERLRAEGWKAWAWGSPRGSSRR